MTEEQVIRYLMKQGIYISVDLGGGEVIVDDGYSEGLNDNEV